MFPLHACVCILQRCSNIADCPLQYLLDAVAWEQLVAGGLGETQGGQRVVVHHHPTPSTLGQTQHNTGQRSESPGHR